MLFDYRYKGSTTVDNSRLDQTAMSFSPDTRREPTFFRGELKKSLAFREAISALHDVVVSDLRWHPKDKTAYKEWAARREQTDWQVLAAERSARAAQIKRLQEEMDRLNQAHWARRGAYEQAKRRYFDYLYKKDRDAWFVLDPVITVHPDEVFFECFSQDESSYGRLGASYEVFGEIGELSCGTTNIDYSAALYDEFQKIRTYKSTRFVVDPSGFDVQTTGEEAYKEVKIDLPDSWVRGFLQVSSAMTLPALKFTLHPLDVHNLCFVLRRHKEQLGPRSLRYLLRPGEPVRVRFDPWGTEVPCPRSRYEGDTPAEVRTWGRRRLHILERLIPLCKGVTVHLLGTGLPSFYVADLGDMSFTLGLSGWSANDWSRAGNFDLMAPRAVTDEMTARRVFAALRQVWLARPAELAERLDLDRATVLGALSAYVQAGRAIYDLNRGVYRARELSREPLPMDRLRFQNEREERATRFALQKGAVQVQASESPGKDGAKVVTLRGTVRDKERTLSPSLTLDEDERIIRAECSCNFYQQNKLFKGPCEHMLALRMKHRREQEK
jgi:hypothetical protein